MSETPENPENGAEALKTTPLTDLHREFGGKMVPFAGYAMPVHYPAGIMKEHLHTRTAAGLFDVSHMGQAVLAPDGDDPAAALETLVPGELQALKPGRMRYTLLLNAEGGILDDLMVGRPTDPDDKRLLLVVNAACKDADFAHIAEKLKGRARLERADDHALLALQGPQAAEVFSRFVPEAATLKFMSGMRATLLGVDGWISRSGYTGEDGYEISVPADRAETLARDLLAQPEVLPIGLGARDSLRLEAGLCLYGHDIDETTTPVEANLAWAIGKRRRAEGGFPGAETILKQLAEGPARRRVGLKPEGRAPVREGAPVTDPAGAAIGTVTSGGFGPSVGAPVAMGYVATAQAETGTPLAFTVRGKSLPGHVADLPFVPQRYYRG
ncbi:MAG: glycine cleavage system aminomethyltransferase GcvT [Alphaproteobacteria bacterium]|nr:glycine cleavage system aminomethyltransferase GcvT [Alphaproteobacteria bacterium]